MTGSDKVQEMLGGKIAAACCGGVGDNRPIFVRVKCMYVWPSNCDDVDQAKIHFHSIIFINNLSVPGEEVRGDSFSTFLSLKNIGGDLPDDFYKIISSFNFQSFHALDSTA